MTKVEKQLQQLKDKALEQEYKLNNDERIVRMEKNLDWFKNELNCLDDLNNKHSNEIERV